MSRAKRTCEDMTICDLCPHGVKKQATPRELPGEGEIKVDMCHEHWKQYQEALKFFNCQWTSTHTAARSAADWEAIKARLLPRNAT